MVGVADENDRFEWTCLDGVPEDVPLTGSPNGPRGGVSASGEDVGRYTSIAADGDGNLHITYRDETNKTLKYIFGQASGQSWDWAEPYVMDEDGDVGLWSEISVGVDGLIAVAYMAPGVPVEDPTLPVATSKLRWAQATAAVPTAADWTFEDVDTQQVDSPCNGGCSAGQKCRADLNVCERSQAASRCDNACADSQSCFEQGDAFVCAEVAQLPTIVSLPEGTGLFASVARFSNGDAAVAYYHRTGGDLMFARQNDGAWQAPVILDGRAENGDDLTDAGQFASIAIDAQDNVHIAYVDAVTDDLRYINLTEGVSELVDDGIRPTPDGVSVNLVGDASAIIIDDEGVVRIAYQDTSAHQLMLARRIEGRWEVLSLAGGGESYTGAYGFYNQHALVEGRSLVTTYRYHRQVDPPLNGLTVHRF